MVGERVVIVHDYLTQRGGAERVVLELLRVFPGARLVTSVWNPGHTFPEFGEYDVETLGLDRVAAFRRDPRRAFPLLARAFARHVIDDADVVICSTSGWAHRVTTSAPKIVYCHNPARWLYQPDDYLRALPAWARAQFVRGTRGLRRTDVAAARSASAYLVNSRVVAERVQAAYGITPDIAFPPRGVDPEGPQQPVPGVEPGFLLTVGRARGYKNTEAVVGAIRELPGERLVCVGARASDFPDAPASVTCLTGIDDAQLRWLYANASALVAVAHEDFGLTPVEAQAFGVPSVVLRANGYLDSTIEDLTGVFVDTPEASAVAQGVRRLRGSTWDHDAVRRAGERFAPATFHDRLVEVINAAAGSRVV